MPQATPDDLDILRKKHSATFARTLQAAANQPREYRALKSMLKDVLSRNVDVSEYYRTAAALADLLQRLNRNPGQTLFSYFSATIDPRQQGDVRYFRYSCRDLADQIRQIDQARADMSHLRRIK